MYDIPAMKILSFAAICGAVAFVQTLPAAETFEIGEHNFEELPRGKEADGIVGDFVIRNDRIEAVISGNLPERRANMSTFYGDGGETPGCLYDLTVKGANNDQITIFTPLGQRGPPDLVGRGDDLEHHALFDLAPPQQGRGGAQVG